VASVIVLALSIGVRPAQARMVAPQVHAAGVDAATASTFEAILQTEIEHRAPGRLVNPTEVAGARPCADPECAARLARRLHAEAALLCTLGRLGGKYVATLQCVDASGRVTWTEQRSTLRLQDLDGVASRLAAALPRREPRLAPRDSAAAERTVADLGTPRPSWSTQGPRVGVLVPVAGSYGGVSQLSSLSYVWRRMTPSFNVEVIPALGYAWGSSPTRGVKAHEWTLFDVNLAWTPRTGDVAPYVGGGLGLHAVHLERDPSVGAARADASSLALAVGGGVILFRTYDFQIACDIRYSQVFSRFEALGGTGARGFAFSFGIMHR
jgi:hypothetical protein